ncbi:hypothetical protein THIOM_002822 [Candidatus Thiomargarita nelsonii]|uniref:Uncharacterized protein n=1 Tax=Candidatus Thiomargarita nelsonii TaxID=1003181 RepID=A0A176S070_9GAMM|nr:hypothetical protein THIOM_002822 [Candidatus Thiomargarita nelsonii]
MTNLPFLAESSKSLSDRIEIFSPAMSIMILNFSCATEIFSSSTVKTFFSSLLVMIILPSSSILRLPPLLTVSSSLIRCWSKNSLFLLRGGRSSSL